ncbi:MAG TPA: ImmA/IrrE family metallo-endopeptidase [Stellaceae bacterium]|nr:ImmA/IrrE family metallo-endopeptidase [Stellaceae bacterium]
MNLATNLGVTVWSAADIPGWPTSDQQHLFGVASGEWSAFVLRERGHHLIVYNPRHSPARTNSDVMHELSHIMLGHELAMAQQTIDGHLLNGNYDEAQEAEADWLAGTLLVPRPALLWMRARRMTDADASRHFGVSNQMLTWRIRMTGVDYQIKRAG